MDLCGLFSCTTKGRRFIGFNWPFWLWYIIIGIAVRRVMYSFSMIHDIEKAFRGIFGVDRALGRLDVACVGAGACALGAVVHNFGVAVGR